MRAGLGALDRLVAGNEIIVSCGPGGVGKTTTAAAMGVALAQRSAAKVLVLTVDPARRLGDALHLSLGDAPRRVDAEIFTSTKRRARGELWAAMVDAPSAWDELIRREAPNVEAADAILSNAFYANITRRFAHSHEYIAMERLYELHASGEYDVLVLDTPPSSDALDLLDAPEKMVEFFSSNLLRVISSSRSSRIGSLASRSFVQFADRVLGTALIDEIGEFLVHFQQLRTGFVERARSVSSLIRDPRTAFVVVTTLETSTVREALRLQLELDRRRMHRAFVVANKVFPPALASEEVASSADRLADEAAAIAALLSSRDPQSFADEMSSERVLKEVAHTSSQFALLANRQGELLEELSKVNDAAITVPHLLHEVVDAAGLVAIGESLINSASSG